MTSPRTMIEQTTTGLRHFVDHLGQYPATMHLVSNDDLVLLNEAADILDRIAQRRETSQRSLNTDWAFYERLETDGVVEATGDITDRPVVTSWWEIHDNVSLLATYMADHGESAQTIAEMVETPWSWTEEFEAAVDDIEMEIAGEQPAGFIQPTHPPQAENQRPT